MTEATDCCPCQWKQELQLSDSSSSSDNSNKKKTKLHKIATIRMCRSYTLRNFAERKPEETEGIEKPAQRKGRRRRRRKKIIETWRLLLRFIFLLFFLLSITSSFLPFSCFHVCVCVCFSSFCCCWEGE